ncbi:MAG: ABC transporter ATP-binding protein [Hyphomonadaceae bacterium]|nr:ABC transporter ATP-binding protein [Hyphomonadaceae bacterium]
MSLTASDVTVRRGGRAIVDGVSVSFARTGLVAVIGPNGAGKSTLLSVLAGLVKPDGGAVTLDGAALAAFDRRALARRRAYLPQNARCEWPIAVSRVVALGLTPKLPALGELPAADRAHVDVAVDAFDLAAFRDQAVTTLSGGELARTMLARALVGGPEILIADEPVAGLDPRHALDALGRLRAHAAQALVIVAVHDLAFAARFADRVVALRAGRIVADGDVDAVLNAQTVRAVFDVDARIDRDATGVSVRYS